MISLPEYKHKPPLFLVPALPCRRSFFNSDRSSRFSQFKSLVVSSNRNTTNHPPHQNQTWSDGTVAYLLFLPFLPSLIRNHGTYIPSDGTRFSRIVRFVYHTLTPCFRTAVYPCLWGFGPVNSAHSQIDLGSAVTVGEMGETVEEKVLPLSWLCVFCRRRRRLFSPCSLNSLVTGDPHIEECIRAD